jgi:hypothetical protein
LGIANVLTRRYIAQETTRIDTDIGGKDHFWMETSYKMNWRRIKMKKTKVVGAVGLVFAILFLVTIVMPSLEAAAQTKVVPIEGVSYNVNASMQDNLKSLMGRKVYVTLNSGKTFTGSVKVVGDNLMHLEKLDGKDYFDALIRIEDISAVDTRFRELVR